MHLLDVHLLLYIRLPLEPQILVLPDVQEAVDVDHELLLEAFEYDVEGRVGACVDWGWRLEIFQWRAVVSVAIRGRMMRLHMRTDLEPVHRLWHGELRRWLCTIVIGSLFGTGGWLCRLRLHGRRDVAVDVVVRVRASKWRRRVVPSIARALHAAIELATMSVASGLGLPGDGGGDPLGCVGDVVVGGTTCSMRDGTIASRSRCQGEIDAAARAPYGRANEVHPICEGRAPIPGVVEDRCSPLVRGRLGVVVERPDEGGRRVGGRLADHLVPARCVHDASFVRRELLRGVWRRCCRVIFVR